MSNIVVPTLMYHRIADVPSEYDPGGTVISPDAFKHQMKVLHDNGYRCVPTSEAARHWQQGLPIERKMFSLTFDDGYRDFYTEVFPILETFGFTATVFLVTSLVGCRSAWEGQSGRSSSDLLTWQQIRELNGLGITFGAHTLTHPRLPTLGDQEARREVEQSKKQVEDHLGSRVDYFSYPYGTSCPRDQVVVRESGFAAAWGGQRGPAGLFNLWRVCVRRNNSNSFPSHVTWRYYSLIRFREHSLIGKTAYRVLKKVRRRT